MRAAASFEVKSGFIDGPFQAKCLLGIVGFQADKLVIDAGHFADLRQRLGQVGAAFDQPCGHLLFQPIVNFFPRGLPAWVFTIQVFCELGGAGKWVREAVSAIDRSHPRSPILLVAGRGDVQILPGFQIGSRHDEMQFRAALILMLYECDVEGVRLLPGEHEILKILRNFFELLVGWRVVRSEGKDAVRVGPPPLV